MMVASERDAPDAPAPDNVDWRIKQAAHVRAATRAAGAGLWEWDLATNRLAFDARASELLGLDAADHGLELNVVFRWVHMEDRGRLAEALQLAANGSGELDTEFRITTGAGEARHLHARAERMEVGRGAAVRLVGSLQDVTSSHQLRDALEQERERLRVTLSSIGDAVIAVDGNAVVTFANPVAAAMTGWDADELLGRPLAEVLNLGEDRSDPALMDAVKASFSALAGPRVCAGAALVPVSGGEPLMVDATASAIRTILGEVLGAVLVLHDVTHAQAMQQQLRHAATHDLLTGLANRRLLQERLAQALETADAVDQALCFIDVDRFKVINDSAGHNAGDVFLKSLVGVLQRFVRPEDLLVRWGGDELGLILWNCDMAEAERRANEMVKAVKDFRFSWDGRVFSSGVSIGLTRIASGATPTELLGQADTACYAAKNAGRGRAVVFTPGEGAASELRQEIVAAADLRQVIEENRLVLFGQEIVPVSPEPGSRPRFEILVRMIDLTGGIVGPGAFVPAAERFSIMHEVDAWVLREAIQTFGAEISRLGCEISLNLSANSLDNPGLLALVTDLLENSPLSPSAVVFEITESAALSQMANASRVMAAMKRLGCRIALDDFGVGSSSLSYLKHFPVDLVKLDGSFISNMTTSEVDRAIVHSINYLAHRIGAKTVAEYVEDEATLAAVKSIGVDYVQGYIHGQPRPLEQILAGLASASAAGAQYPPMVTVPVREGESAGVGARGE